MNKEQFDKVGAGQGFIAALDQSGGSTPKALKLYGIEETAYSNEAEMCKRISALTMSMTVSGFMEQQQNSGVSDLVK